MSSPDDSSASTLRVIRQNIVAALSVKAAFVLLTILGHANLWTAIAADMGGVTLSGLQRIAAVATVEPIASNLIAGRACCASLRSRCELA